MIYTTTSRSKTKDLKEERDRLMKKFLEKQRTKIRTQLSYKCISLDKSKKPAFTREDIKEGKTGHAPKPNYDTYKKGSYHDFDVGGDNPPRWEKQPKNDMAGK